MKQSTLPLLLILALFTFQFNYVSAQLQVSPDTAKVAQVLPVTFTTSSGDFSTVSGFCLYPKLFRFDHQHSSFTMYTSSVSKVNNDTLTGVLNIPSNVPFGNYDVSLACGTVLNCIGCFEIKPDSLLNGDDVSVYIGQVGPALRGFDVDYAITYQNKSKDTADVEVILIHDPVLNYDTTSLTYTSRIGDTIRWNINDLLPGATGYHTVTFNIPAMTPLGDSLEMRVEILPVVGDLDPSDNNYSTKNRVVGSYDPNDKQVTPDGLTPLHTELLNFKVRFQNTGTAQAKKVVIVDTISPSLDINTFRTLATSHAYVAEVISGTPNTVKWTFNDINLPDSGTNWLGSMGFVAYEIAPVPGLAIGDSIANFADIYFDFNPPIRTNTTKNYFFDCDSLANFELLTDSLCLGEAVAAVQNGFGATQLYWELGGALLDSVRLLNQPVNVNGTMALELTASNHFCTNVQHDSVYVLDVTAPVITANGNQLVSDLSNSIQWFFDGVLIAGATNDTLLAQQNGWYKVRHIAPNGCVVFSDSVEVTSVGLEALTGQTSVWVYPNPSNGMLYLSSTEKWSGQMQLRVYSLSGQLLYKQRIQLDQSGQNVKIDLRALQTGTYIMVMDREGKDTFRQVVVIANKQ